jgi:prepilin-type N-terminal cleavage/methylation domain-containing protein
MKKTKGFTLIELLVVISLIAILSGVILSVININGIRQKTRDAQRIADLKKVQTALELYFADHRSYPSLVSGCDTISTMLTSDLIGGTVKYIVALPTDPVSGNSYYYSGTTGYYVLAAAMEVASSVTTGNACASLSNWGTSGCASLTNCYGVQNPF